MFFNLLSKETQRMNYLQKLNYLDVFIIYIEVGCVMIIEKNKTLRKARTNGINSGSSIFSVRFHPAPVK
jgi:hypothetical protein